MLYFEISHSYLHHFLSNLVLYYASDTKQTRLTGISKALCLAVAYSATLGGITTLTGNGANMIPKHIIDK